MSGDNFDNGMIGMPYESMITFVGKTKILMNLMPEESETNGNLSCFKTETEQFTCQEHYQRLLVDFEVKGIKI